MSVAPFSPADFAERDFVFEWVHEGRDYSERSKECVKKMPEGVETVWVHYKDWEQGRLYRVLNGYVHLHLLEMG
jgi:hypothetical protein